MLIIIEGPDKSGKTTLAQAIERTFGYEYVHFGIPGPDPASEYVKFLLDLKKPTVTDRFYLGERVYSTILRNKQTVTELEYAVIERLCRLRAAILIYVSTPLGICQKRLKVSVRENVNLEQNRRAWQCFLKVAQGVNIEPLYRYDTSRATVAEMLKILRPQLAYRIEKAAEAVVYCHGLGTIINPRFIVVGERVNRNRPGWGLPFCAGPSSQFLFDKMQEARVPEKDVYTTNADTLTKEEVGFLGADKFWLSLGREASKRLNKLHVPQLCIPHPSYWKRFHHKDPETYTGYLRSWREINR
jgi:thymidylate kinase